MPTKKHKTNAGVELLFLLRQQRYLYHQLKLLTERQRQLGQASSPEIILEVIFGRRKLIEKLRELNEKLRPIKANWRKLSRQIDPESKAQAHEMASQVQEIIGQILAGCPSETTRNLPLQQNWKHGELFAETKTR